jgi:hypothetical protein
MHVIIHQAIMIDGDGVLFSGFQYKFQEIYKIIRTSKDLLPVIAPCQNMVITIILNLSSYPWHKKSPPKYMKT